MIKVSLILSLLLFGCNKSSENLKDHSNEIFNSSKEIIIQIINNYEADYNYNYKIGFVVINNTNQIDLSEIPDKVVVKLKKHLGIKTLGTNFTSMFYEQQKIEVKPLNLEILSHEDFNEIMYGDKEISEKNYINKSHFILKYQELYSCEYLFVSTIIFNESANKAFVVYHFDPIGNGHMSFYIKKDNKWQFEKSIYSL